MLTGRNVRDLWVAAKRKRRDILRIAMQTALAASVTYGVMTWMGGANVSSAVVAALFTIELSVDASYAGALGRMGGAILGVAFGLAANWLLGPVLVSLAVSAALANAVATVWPNLRYAAVTAAIVALEPAPDVGGGLTAALAIVSGTGVGAAASLAIWPVFGRQRATQSMRSAIDDCQDLLEMITEGAERPNRDALHARFLGHLESVHTRVAETRFKPALPCGVDLREAAVAVETFWHTLVLLDRVLSRERHLVHADAIERLRPSIHEVQAAATECLSELRAEIRADDPNLPETRRLKTATRAAREASEAIESNYPGPDGLHAVSFALGEIERRLDELLNTLRREDDARVS